jgi:hypothetical protein
VQDVGFSCNARAAYVIDTPCSNRETVKWFAWPEGFSFGPVIWNWMSA